MPTERPAPEFAAVIIGLNEGERLRRCITSVTGTTVIVYVDSGSTDGSQELARQAGAIVVDLDRSKPFTAARARNAGFHRVKLAAPNCKFVQFVDGDCELAPGWARNGLSFLEEHPEVAAVCGILKERNPERSIYNWLCEREWDGPSGEIRAFAGNVLMRAAALEVVGGYRDDVLAAEEDELSLRLRRAGWKIWRLPKPMAWHDANMVRFGQWWQRSQRGGYGYAQGAFLHGAGPERHFVWESRRAIIWGLVIPLACACLAFTYWPLGLASLLIFPFQFTRQTIRNSGSLRERSKLAVFQLFARFAEASGQIKFLIERLSGRQSRILRQASLDVGRYQA